MSGQWTRPEEVIITWITFIVLTLFLFFRTKAVYKVREKWRILVFFFWINKPTSLFVPLGFPGGGANTCPNFFLLLLKRCLLADRKGSVCLGLSGWSRYINYVMSKGVTLTSKCTKTFPSNLYLNKGVQLKINLC